MGYRSSVVGKIGKRKLGRAEDKDMKGARGRLLGFPAFPASLAENPNKHKITAESQRVQKK